MTFLQIDLRMLKSFCEFLMNFGWISTGIHNKTCKFSKKPYFQLSYKLRQSKGFAFALPLTKQCERFGRFFSRIKGQKCHFFGEFSRIAALKRSLAVCTTVVQLGILRLMHMCPSISVASRALFIRTLGHH